jgi:hypothetical protein
MKSSAAIILLVSLAATVARAQAPDRHDHGIQNVVVIFQENRTPGHAGW